MYALAIVSQLIQPASVSAKDRMVDPGLAYSVSYTDNVDLAPSDQALQEWIAQITPSLSMHMDGRKITGDMTYQMQNIFYARDFVTSNQNRSRVFHQLDADGKVEFIADRLGVDVSADYQQRNGGDQQITTFDNYSLTGNSINTARATLSPYAAYQFDDYAVINMRYAYNRIDYEGLNIFDAETNNVRLSLQSGRQFKRFAWLVSGRRNKINYYSRPDISFNNAVINTQYKLRPRLTMLVNVGYELNRYPYLSSQSSPQGRYWSSGITWKLGGRTVVNVLTGERYYGDTFSFMFQRRARHGPWSFNYNEDVVTGLGGVTGQDYSVSLFQQDPMDEPASTELPGVEEFYDRLNPLTSTEAFVRKRMILDQVFNNRKSSLHINVIFDNNLYQLSGDKERILIGNATWLLRMASNVSLKISEYGQYIEYRDQATKGLMQRFSINLERQLNQYITGSVAYRYTSRDTNNSLGEYKQNFIELGMRLSY